MGWTYTFTGLDKYDLNDNFREYVYTVGEAPVENYITVIPQGGYRIYNNLDVEGRLSITKVVLNANNELVREVQTGTPVTYTLTVTNDGPIYMYDVVVTDSFFTSDGFTVTGVTLDGSPAGIIDGMVAIGTMRPGEVRVITYSVVLTNTGETDISVPNTASVEGYELEEDFEDPNNPVDPDDPENSERDRRRRFVEDNYEIVVTPADPNEPPPPDVPDDPDDPVVPFDPFDPPPFTPVDPATPAATPTFTLMPTDTPNQFVLLEDETPLGTVTLPDEVVVENLTEDEIIDLLDDVTPLDRVNPVTGDINIGGYIISLISLLGASFITLVNGKKRRA
jgi:uncharacterized repeat protein (TIGR01451 family)